MQTSMPRNPSFPVAVPQQESANVVGLSHFNTAPGSENISIFAAPGQRMGVSVFAVKGQVKVANVAPDGLAKTQIVSGDVILEVNGRRVLTEREANKAMVEATGEIVLKVLKRNRNTDSDSSSQDSTERDAPSTGRTLRAEQSAPTPRSSAPKNMAARGTRTRVLSFTRRQKPASPRASFRS